EVGLNLWYCAIPPTRARSRIDLIAATSDVVGLGGTGHFRACFLSPPPARDLRHVVAVPADVCLVVDQLVADRLFGVRSSCPKLGDAIDDLTHQMEAVKVVEHAHVERRRGGALLFVATHMDVVVAPSPVGQAVNERWVTVKGEDDGLVRREQLVE